MNPSNVYRSKSRIDADSTTADVLAAGDSWFWYPFPGGSLIDKLGFMMEHQHNILVAGQNGAEAVDFTTGKYKTAYKELIRLFGSGASALFVSAGGNDVAGMNDLRPLLKGDCSAATTAQECFIQGNKPGTLAYLIEKIFESHTLMITRALNKMPLHGRIYLHTYDYAIPDGRGGWLKPSLDDAKVPVALQHACVKLVIDAAADNMFQLSAWMPDRIRVIDTRGTLAPDQWANELHPTSAGFNAIAQVWKQTLVADGIVR